MVSSFELITSLVLFVDVHKLDKILWSLLKQVCVRKIMIINNEAIALLYYDK